jgi:cytochrome c biogenesis protein CcmG/thiol:disulfide interchange protein DsbE
MTPLQRRSLLLIPLGAAAIGGAAFWLLLDRMSEGTYDPHSLPSMLIGKPLPAFSLPGGALPIRTRRSTPMPS